MLGAAALTDFRQAVLHALVGLMRNHFAECSGDLRFPSCVLLLLNPFFISVQMQISGCLRPRTFHSVS